MKLKNDQRVRDDGMQPEDSSASTRLPLRMMPIRVLVLAWVWALAWQSADAVAPSSPGARPWR